MSTTSTTSFTDATSIQFCELVAGRATSIDLKNRPAHMFR
jgi:hypothetical protein